MYYLILKIVTFNNITPFNLYKVRWLLPTSTWGRCLWRVQPTYPIELTEKLKCEWEPIKTEEGEKKKKEIEKEAEEKARETTAVIVIGGEAIQRIGREIKDWDEQDEVEEQLREQGELKSVELLRI